MPDIGSMPPPLTPPGGPPITGPPAGPLPGPPPGGGPGDTLVKGGPPPGALPSYNSNSPTLEPPLDIAEFVFAYVEGGGDGEDDGPGGGPKGKKRKQGPPTAGPTAKRKNISGSSGISNPHFKPSVRLALTTCMLDLARIMSEAKFEEAKLSAEQEEWIAATVIATAKEIGLISKMEAKILRSQAAEARAQAIASIIGGALSAGFGAAGMRPKWGNIAMSLGAVGSGLNSITQGIGGIMAAGYKMEQAELTVKKGIHEQIKHLQENLAKAIERFQQNCDEAKKAYDADLTAMHEAIRQAIQANLTAHSYK